MSKRNKILLPQGQVISEIMNTRKNIMKKKMSKYNLKIFSPLDKNIQPKG